MARRRRPEPDTMERLAAIRAADREADRLAERLAAAVMMSPTIAADLVRFVIDHAAPYAETDLFDDDGRVVRGRACDACGTAEWEMDEPGNCGCDAWEARVLVHRMKEVARCAPTPAP